jgi:hypothetical protein
MLAADVFAKPSTAQETVECSRCQAMILRGLKSQVLMVISYEV